MSPMRPLDRDDLDAVAGLYELVVRSGTSAPAPGLAEQFARTVLDHPWADEDLPSLVYEDPKAGIVGFLASHPRRLRFGERDLRVACSGQFVSHPDFRRRGVGALLLRRYLAGPQDVSLTDGATDEVRAMWQMLGGTTNGLASVSWTRVLRPAAFAGSFLAHRAGRAGGRLPGLLDRIGMTRALAPSAPDATSEPLTPAALVDGLAELADDFPLRPAYDEAFVDWLFRELATVRRRGELETRLVRGGDGRILGWYIVYLDPGESAQAIQVVATERDAGAVLDELFHTAAAAGSTAVSGRIEPHLQAALRGRRCLFMRSEWALVHSAEPELLAAIAGRGALLTRLEGEWWMGHHLR